MPTFQVVAPCHKDSVLNSAFASDYGDLISNNRIDVWIYGHSHTNIDAEIGGTKVLSNQMGYVFQNEHLMNGFDSGKYENKEDFFRDWHSFNPMETRWFHVASSIYMERRAIRFTDRKYTRFVVSNYSSYVSDNNEYYNDEWCRETSIKALEYSVNGRSVPPLETMTIRQYCKYFRIAHEVYESFYRNLPVSKYNQTEQTYGPNELHDVAYYNRMKFAKIDEQYDIDSPDDFIWFAKDHYGELGLSCLNIFASDTERSGWVIVVSNSYSANAGLAIEVATALYKSGVPLIIHDADKLLKILEEEDYVRLVPYSYHNYMGYQEEGSVYELPWEYECSEDSGSSLTAEQYKEIVSFAEWQEEERVKVD